ncbi:MAG TPA: hypothetical protein VGY55_21685 [Pirellulales bacterium]|jgi:hypothetical protein|nr:hypothetical protein [Pirellulales bacterium]
MSIVFQGLSDESSFERGALMVSGLGYYASEEHSSTGYFERMHYSWGVAEIQINDRVVRITDFGRKLTYKGKTIDIPGKSPLNLVIDASGRLSRTGNEEKQ